MESQMLSYRDFSEHWKFQGKKKNIDFDDFPNSNAHLVLEFPG